MAEAHRVLLAPTRRCGCRFFGPSGRFRINLQARYDLETEKDRLGDALDEIRPLSVASRLGDLHVLSLGRRCRPPCKGGVGQPVTKGYGPIGRAMERVVERQQ